MVAPSIQVLSPALRSRLFAIQQTSAALDTTQLRLASGKKVNSALDNPQSFFAARSLGHRASDLSRLLDGIGQNIQAVKAADIALQAVNKLLEQADALGTTALETLGSGSGDLSQLILADDPVAYWRLNETEGNVAENLGTGGAAINGTYQGGVTPGTGEELYLGGGDVNTVFDGVNDRVRIPDSLLINTDNAGYPERTIELVFKAEDLSAAAGRQVLYEEGGTANAIAIYVDNGRIYFNARDAGDWGPFDISAEIEEGETYHATLVIDDPRSEFRAYLNADLVDTATITKPLNRHTANIGIGRMQGDTFFHDGPANGNGFHFHGQIADVAIYNSVISEDKIQERYDTTRLEESKAFEREFEDLMLQLDILAFDATYRGVNLLMGDTLRTIFNENRTSFLDTEGDFFTSDGLDVSDASFRRVVDIRGTLDEIRSALEEVRSFGTKLATDLNIIQARSQFTNSMINTLQEGGDKLTLADQNLEGSRLLALQTRQAIQVSTLTINTFSIADFLLQG